MTLCTTKAEKEAKTKLPNILFAIADDNPIPTLLYMERKGIQECQEAKFLIAIPGILQ